MSDRATSARNTGNTAPSDPPLVEKVGSHPFGAVTGVLGGAALGTLAGMAAGPVGSLFGAVGGALIGGALGASTRVGPEVHVAGPALRAGRRRDRLDNATDVDEEKR